MGQITVYLCDECKNEALVPFEAADKTLCPRCALVRCSDRIRAQKAPDVKLHHALREAKRGVRTSDRNLAKVLKLTRVGRG